MVSPILNSEMTFDIVHTDFFSSFETSGWSFQCQCLFLFFHFSDIFWIFSDKLSPIPNSKKIKNIYVCMYWNYWRQVFQNETNQLFCDFHKLWNSGFVIGKLNRELIHRMKIGCLQIFVLVSSLSFSITLWKKNIFTNFWCPAIHCSCCSIIFIKIVTYNLLIIITSMYFDGSQR